ncbi:MAG: hypothetical protein E6R08_01025 [Nevskiaceae bacterium]|nr:MAG: hypothetical protein E6R08_01025 [Nevskiaceae bacterium]
MGEVTDLQARRVERVKQLARQAAMDPLRGEAAFAMLRDSVAGELVNQGSIAVTKQAMEGLQGEEAQSSLRRAIQDANRVFYLGDRALAAVVVPVAIRYTSARQDAVSVWHGKVESMQALSMVVKNATGARQVAFDARFYRGSQILGAQARDLRDHLVRIETGEVQQKGLTKSTALKSGPESSWEVIYFLGVAVFDRGAESILLNTGVEKAMLQMKCHAEWAMDQADPVAWTEGVKAEAVCLGYYSMHRGLQIGEDELRTLQLDSMVSNMELGVTGLLFRYAVDDANDRIRLLITSNVHSAEYVWRRYGEDGVAAFKAGLDKVIKDRVADVRDIQEMSLDEYKAAAQLKGIVW